MLMTLKTFFDDIKTNLFLKGFMDRTQIMIFLHSILRKQYELTFSAKKLSYCIFQELVVTFTQNHQIILLFNIVEIFNNLLSLVGITIRNYILVFFKMKIKLN